MGMTATERLRALLDERGVVWKEHRHALAGSMAIQRETLWGQPIDNTNGKPIPHVYHCRATEMGDGRLFLEAQLVTPEQAIAATLGDSDTTGARQRDAVEVVRCRDCKHGHITINGESCKWCDLIATHDIDGNEPNNGYDPEPYFDADFFCAWGRRADG